MEHGPGLAGTPAPTPVQLAALRPHVVELQDGKFATTAELNTTPADVDAIFATHLPAFVQARGGGGVPVVFWAHGGLVDERKALAQALHDIPWWLANGIYPVHFVWHTGFWETLGELLAQHYAELDAAAPLAGRHRAAVPVVAGTVPAPLPGPAPAGPGAVSDAADTDVTDGLIEDLLRFIGGPEVWAAMKDSARLASEPGGGAAYVADALRAYVAAHPGQVSVHAAGFSAGANFQRYFVPAVVRDGTAGVKSCNLLVPALRTASFKEGLEPLLGTGIQRLALFGMHQDLALADNTFGIYHKSLLYLVRAALDSTPGTPILGLQQCINEDPGLAALFKEAPAAGVAEAVWSVAAGGPLDARSTATTHTAFDNDAPTMDSVARRILGRDSIVSYGATQHRGVLRAAAQSAP
ncbi:MULTISPECIES: hypothetical protein [unclassified Arthrobacter]|uniref:hypothetical protein n=1 Tax=unclassified Arthrobacter TaxID=235627 RepID=UPI00159E67C0|nr:MULTISPECIES: hypothetical protein [unclassified Arthrobacter]MCQ9165327.1 hypothetical protein [Arthrobacter sp. STN4]NVN00124.1 hypothetical protein [Arthrobacter sp. SDTb3-6]